VNYSVFLIESAKRDIDEIVSYIAEQSGSDAALRIVTGLEQCWRNLSTLPHRGNVPKELVTIGRTDYRQLHYKPWRIIYRVEGRRVIVYAVADGRRNMEDFLRRRLSRPE
jgi:toxin ParE1/3/4